MDDCQNIGCRICINHGRFWPGLIIKYQYHELQSLRHDDDDGRGVGEEKRGLDDGGDANHEPRHGRAVELQVQLSLDRRPLLLQIHGHDLKVLTRRYTESRKVWQKGEIAVPSRFRCPVLSVGLVSFLRGSGRFQMFADAPRKAEVLPPEGACLSLHGGEGLLLVELEVQCLAASSADPVAHKLDLCSTSLFICRPSTEASLPQTLRHPSHAPSQAQDLQRNHV